MTNNNEGELRRNSTPHHNKSFAPNNDSRRNSTPHNIITTAHNNSNSGNTYDPRVRRGSDNLSDVERIEAGKALDRKLNSFFRSIKSGMKSGVQVAATKVGNDG